MKKFLATKKFTSFLLIILIILLGADLYVRLAKGSDNEKIISANFACAGDKAIESQFHNGKINWVELKLSDGRVRDLAQGPSASGARYVDERDNFVFWNKGDTAFITEDGQETYTNCVIR